MGWGGRNDHRATRGFGMSTDSEAGARDIPDLQWRDRKKKLWLLGLVPPTALFVATALVWAGNALGWQAVTPALWWIGPLLVYVLVPTLDVFVGPDGENPPEELVEALENDRYYRYCTYIYLPFQFATLVFACYLWSADNLSWLGIDGGLGIVSKMGLALSVGVVAGIGINTAHEMGHKKVQLERRLSRIALAQSFYGHFYIEHNRGHHVRVATPEDPASARFGESFWAFLPRTVVGSVRSAWQLERARLERLGKPVWSLRNDVLSAWALSAVLFAGLIAVFGFGIAPSLVIQAVFGFALLEAVNYLEHYGLLRQRTANGRYERCSPAAQLEQRSSRDQHLPLPPAAAQRPSRQPDPPLPDAAQHGRRPNLPAGYATHDRPRLRPARCGAR